jgi:hypothetical protein
LLLLTIVCLIESHSVGREETTKRLQQPGPGQDLFEETDKNLRLLLPFDGNFVSLHRNKTQKL